MASAMTARSASERPPRGLGRSGYGARVVVERPGDADAGALEGVGVQELRVITVRRRLATVGGRVVRVRRRALERAHQDRRVGDRARHGPRGVLVAGDGDDAPAAHAPTVGLIAASMFALDGDRMEPDVSVPTLAAQKLIAVPMPELEPPTPITGRPSFVPSRGSRLGS
jgi:hypothetical protein